MCLFSLRKQHSLSDTSQALCVACLHAFCMQVPSVPTPPASQMPLALCMPDPFTISAWEPPSPGTQQHYNYFHFLVSTGHGTSVNNNLSLWTSLYLYISDPIAIGTWRCVSSSFLPSRYCSSPGGTSNEVQNMVDSHNSEVINT